MPCGARRLRRLRSSGPARLFAHTHRAARPHCRTAVPRARLRRAARTRRTVPLVRATRLVREVAPCGPAAAARTVRSVSLGRIVRHAPSARGRDASVRLRVDRVTQRRTLVRDRADRCEPAAMQLGSGTRTPGSSGGPALGSAWTKRSYAVRADAPARAGCHAFGADLRAAPSESAARCAARPAVGRRFRTRRNAARHSHGSSSGQDGSNPARAPFRTVRERR
jgi:hypothetical protein